MPMSNYSGMIFDFNGVLWWDNGLQEEAWRTFSARVRSSPLSTAEMAEHVHGRNNHYTLEYLSDGPLSAERGAQLSEQKETIYRQLCLAQENNFRLSPGAESLLDFLLDKSFIMKGVCQRGDSLAAGKKMHRQLIGVCFATKLTELFTQPGAKQHEKLVCLDLRDMIKLCKLCA